MAITKSCTPYKHNRRSIRFTNFNYANPGYYFVTIVVQNRLPVFGAIKDQCIVLNDAGIMIRNEWQNIPQRFDIVTIDQFVIMPDHFHGILKINDPTNPPPVGKPLVGFHDGNKPNDKNIDNVGIVENGEINENMVSPDVNETDDQKGVPPTLFDIVGAFKSITTNKYIDGVKQNDWQSFNKKLWQFQYHDRIIRDEKHLSATRNYIKNNHP